MREPRLYTPADAVWDVFGTWVGEAGRVVSFVGGGLKLRSMARAVQGVLGPGGPGGLGPVGLGIRPVPDFGVRGQAAIGRGEEDEP